MAYPFIPLPPSKKGSSPPPILFKFQPFLWGVVVRGGGGLCGGALFLYYHRDKVSTLLISIIAILILKLIQFCYSYCYNHCLVHMTSCWNSFLVQILSGRLHQHQPQPSTAPPLSCIYPVQWGMFCFQRSSCHICVLPCAEYWCKPDTWC